MLGGASAKICYVLASPARRADPRCLLVAALLSCCAVCFGILALAGCEVVALAGIELPHVQATFAVRHISYVVRLGWKR